MTDNMKKFIEFMSSQDEDTYKKASKMEEDELIAFAAENGITVTPEDFAEAKKEAEAAAEGEISDDELSAVAGGKACACIFGGGGEPSDPKSSTYDTVCACVMAGEGRDSTGDDRCGCPLVGGGVTRG